MPSQFSLLKTRRFLPLFVAQFLGAFNDNVFKNALVILIAYRLSGQSALSSPLLVTLAAGIFILPFFLLSATAGELADRHDKAVLIRWIKFAEIIIMGFGAVGFLLNDLWFLLAVLFLMGAQSAFFGPLKYGILPDHLERDELMGGNGLIEASTFLAILLGTVLGGVLALRESGITMVAITAIGLAVIGFGASRFIPSAAPAQPDLRPTLNPFRAMGKVIAAAARPRDVLVSALGISWFWFVGATFLAQFPNLAKDSFGGDETVVVLFLILFAIGIAIGSLLCNLLLRGQLSPRLVPWAALVLSLASIDFYFAAEVRVPDETLIAVGAFIADAAHWRVIADLVLVSAAGGVFVVPLYALIQARTAASHRARAIAALNIFNSAFMVASAAIGMAVLALGGTVPLLLAATGALTLPVGLALWLFLVQRARRTASATSALASGPSHSAGPT